MPALTSNIGSAIKEAMSLSKAYNAYGTLGAVGKLAKDAYKGMTTPGGVFGPAAPASAGSTLIYGGGGPTQNNSAPVSTPYGPSPIFDKPVSTGPTAPGNYGGGGTAIQDVGQSLQMQNDAISGQYSEEQKRLNNMEDATRNLYGQTIAQAQGYYPEFQKLVGDQQTSTDTQLNSMTDARKMESDRAMNQARQLLNDLNRRQAAQMSASGTYGSSVPEAYAQQFGNRAYDAQNQIQTSRDQSLNDIAQKHVEATNYFNQKLFEGKQKYDALVTGLKSELDNQIAQINSARTASSQAKRAGILEAWNNYVNNKFSIDQELRNYNTQLALTHTALGNLATDQTGNKVNGYVAPAVDSSNNSKIVGPDQGVGSQQNLNQFTAMNSPIYPTKKLTPEEMAFYKTQSPTGLQLNNGGVTA